MLHFNNLADEQAYIRDLRDYIRHRKHEIQNAALHSQIAEDRQYWTRRFILTLALDAALEEYNYTTAVEKLHQSHVLKDNTETTT